MREHHVAWLVVVGFLGTFLWLLVAVSNAPESLAQPLWRGVNVGHALVLALHLGGVLAAWCYIFGGNPESNPPSDLESNTQAHDSSGGHS